MSKIVIECNETIANELKKFTNEQLLQFVMRGKKDIEYRKGYMKKRNADAKEGLALLRAQREEKNGR